MIGIDSVFYAKLFFPNKSVMNSLFISGLTECRPPIRRSKVKFPPPLVRVFESLGQILNPELFHQCVTMYEGS